MSKVVPLNSRELMDDEIADAGMFNTALSKDKLGTALDVRDYYREFDVPDCRNEEAIAKAELAALVFRAKRHVLCKSVRSDEIDRVVAATEKATIATARRMKREDELRRCEQEVVELRREFERIGAVLPPDWLRD